MHAYSKRFLQVLLVEIQMVTYIADACLSKLEFLIGRVPKFLKFPWQVLFYIIIGSVSESRWKKSKWRSNKRKNDYSPAYTRDWRALEGWYARRFCKSQVESGRSSLTTVWFAWFLSRVRSIGLDLEWPELARPYPWSSFKSSHKLNQIIN